MKVKPLETETLEAECFALDEKSFGLTGSVRHRLRRRSGRRRGLVAVVRVFRRRSHAEDGTRRQEGQPRARRHRAQAEGDGVLGGLLSLQRHLPNPFAQKLRFPHSIALTRCSRSYLMMYRISLPTFP